MNRSIRRVEMMFIVHNHDSELCRFIEELMQQAVDPNSPIVIFDDRVIQPTYDQIVAQVDPVDIVFPDTVLCPLHPRHEVHEGKCGACEVDFGDPYMGRFAKPRLTQEEAFEIETRRMAQLPAGIGERAAMDEINASWARLCEAED